jgi:dTDP-glucose pyrophosphorylase
MAAIERGGKRICLVVDEERRLLDTVTDGDIRRAILAGLSLELPLEVLRERRSSRPNPHPVSAPAGTERAEMLALMQKHGIHQLPLVDGEGRVAGLSTLDELLPEEVVPIQAVVMAGGFGTRLRPLTENTPKPMLPVGDRPLLEHIIGRLRDHGIQRVDVTTHYQPEKIRDHFGDGGAFGVELNYINEAEPLGTAGALGLVAPPAGPQVVINGDILTRVDFRAMMAFHREHGADLTVGVREYDLQVPYGVLECDGPMVRRVREKPMYSFFVSAGVYVLEPSVYDFIPSAQRMDMPDLIEQLIETGRKVVGFPIVEYWLDIGQHGDYAKAQTDASAGRFG